MRFFTFIDNDNDRYLIRLRVKYNLVQFNPVPIQFYLYSTFFFDKLLDKPQKHHIANQ